MPDNLEVAHHPGLDGGSKANASLGDGSVDNVCNAGCQAQEGIVAGAMIRPSRMEPDQIQSKPVWEGTGSDRWYGRAQCTVRPRSCVWPRRYGG